MAVWKRLLLAWAVTVSVTVLLSVLPHADRRMAEHGRDVAVFRPSFVKRLGSDNLVDSMIGLQLSLKLKKVEWKQGVLSADLSAEDKPEDLKAWMDDMERLLYLAFVRTDNVSRVLIRIVETQSGDSGGRQSAAEPQAYRMLAAADVRRTDSWLSSDLSRVSEANPVLDEVWRERLRMTVTGRAMSRFREANGTNVSPGVARTDTGGDVPESGL